MVDRPQQNPEVRRTIEEYGDHVRFFQADVSCRVDNESMVRFAVDEFHALDILFNNAGVELLKAITETSDEEWDHVLDVNLRGVFLGCRAAVPVMKKVKRGVIVNTASQLGLVGLPNLCILRFKGRRHCDDESAGCGASAIWHQGQLHLPWSCRDPDAGTRD